MIIALRRRETGAVTWSMLDVVERSRNVGLTNWNSLASGPPSKMSPSTFQQGLAEHRAGSTAPLLWPASGSASEETPTSPHHSSMADNLPDSPTAVSETSDSIVASTRATASISIEASAEATARRLYVDRSEEAIVRRESVEGVVASPT